MNYRNMTMLQLRAAAKEKGLRGVSTLKKEQLLERLLEAGDEERMSEKASSREVVGVFQSEKTERNGSGYSSGERAERTGGYSGGERTERTSSRYGGGDRLENGMKSELASLDSGVKADGILEVMPDGYGFIRCENYLPGENDVYVSPSQIRRFNLKTGDILVGNIRVKTQNEKYSALLYVESVNGYKPYEAQKRKSFEDLTPIFPNERICLEEESAPISMRMVDLLSPIGKGQRGMIVSQPKTGKTTLMKQIAKSITTSYPDMKLIVLLIDERPEEVTDIREYIEGPNAEVIYSTFDELPEHHKRVSEMVLERAKRLVEHGEDVVILLDSITRLARAYNLVVPPSGRTLSGGLDPAALHMPKKFFGAARNMREGGSLTILATALVDTGSKMDDVVFEEFKGTGNMELVLDRKLAEKRIFPAINIQKSGTRREDLLLTKEEQEIAYSLHREMSGSRAEENVEQIVHFFKKTKNNKEFIQVMRQTLHR
ncbi:MAG: transcription termination factor Rho [Eubacteriales bacterium]|nr:transcription termination factor Rho [Eubacteriales bacterium]